MSRSRCRSRSRLSTLAWMLTSSAETGSSQTISLRLQRQARAMPMRCRCPPENSAGEADRGVRVEAHRCQQLADPARSVRAIVMHGQRLTHDLARRTAAGSSEEYGSWKTICRSAPERAGSALSPRPVSVAAVQRDAAARSAGVQPRCSSRAQGGLAAARLADQGQASRPVRRSEAHPADGRARWPAAGPGAADRKCFAGPHDEHRSPAGAGSGRCVRRSVGPGRRSRSTSGDRRGRRRRPVRRDGRRAVARRPTVEQRRARAAQGSAACGQRGAKAQPARTRSPVGGSAGDRRQRARRAGRPAADRRQQRPRCTASLAESANTSSTGADLHSPCPRT